MPTNLLQVLLLRLHLLNLFRKVTVLVTLLGIYCNSVLSLKVNFSLYVFQQCAIPSFKALVFNRTQYTSIMAPIPCLPIPNWSQRYLCQTLVKGALAKLYSNIPRPNSSQRYLSKTLPSQRYLGQILIKGT